MKVNFRPVIFTDRGKNGTPLKSQVFFGAGYNDGLAKVLDTVMDTYVDAKVIFNYQYSLSLFSH